MPQNLKSFTTMDSQMKNHRVQRINTEVHSPLAPFLLECSAIFFKKSLKEFNYVTMH